MLFNAFGIIDGAEKITNKKQTNKQKKNKQNKNKTKQSITQTQQQNLFLQCKVV